MKRMLIMTIVLVLVVNSVGLIVFAEKPDVTPQANMDKLKPKFAVEETYYPLITFFTIERVDGYSKHVIGPPGLATTIDGLPREDGKTIFTYLQSFEEPIRVRLVGRKDSISILLENCEIEDIRLLEYISSTDDMYKPIGEPTSFAMKKEVIRADGGKEYETEISNLEISKYFPCNGIQADYVSIIVIQLERGNDIWEYANILEPSTNQNQLLRQTNYGIRESIEDREVIETKDAVALIR